jgi:hypothetical protein
MSSGDQERCVTDAEKYSRSELMRFPFVGNHNGDGRIPSSRGNCARDDLVYLFLKL